MGLHFAEKALFKQTDFLRIAYKSVQYFNFGACPGGKIFYLHIYFFAIRHSEFVFVAPFVSFFLALSLLLTSAL